MIFLTNNILYSSINLLMYQRSTIQLPIWKYGHSFEFNSFFKFFSVKLSKSKIETIIMVDYKNNFKISIQKYQ
jgi:hypothetical protein